MDFKNITTLLASTAIETESALESVLDEVGANAAETSNALSTLINNFSTERFLDSFPYMGIGMLGIFIVMGTIIIGTAILNKVTNQKK